MAFSPVVKCESRAIILLARANVISSPFHPNLPIGKAVVAAWRTLSSCTAGAVELIPRSCIHEEFVQREARSLRRQADRLRRRRAASARHSNYSVHRRRWHRARYLESDAARINSGRGPRLWLPAARG